MLSELSGYLCKLFMIFNGMLFKVSLSFGNKITKGTRIRSSFDRVDFFFKVAICFRFVCLGSPCVFCFFLPFAFSSSLLSFCQYNCFLFPFQPFKFIIKITDFFFDILNVFFLNFYAFFKCFYFWVSISTFLSKRVISSFEVVWIR